MCSGGSLWPIFVVENSKEGASLHEGMKPFPQRIPLTCSCVYSLTHALGENACLVLLENPNADSKTLESKQNQGHALS